MKKLLSLLMAVFAVYDGYYLLEDDGIKFDLPGVKLDRLLNIHANIKKK